jgi:hypothetical protein
MGEKYELLREALNMDNEFLWVRMKEVGDTSFEQNDEFDLNIVFGPAVGKFHEFHACGSILMNMKDTREEVAKLLF